MTLINPESPCTRVCILDARTGWCLGCGRTGEEIGAWSGMSAAERGALKALLPARLLVIAGKDDSTRDPKTRDTGEPARNR